MSQDGMSDSVLCITTLSTMINLFQGNQSVLFSDMKGDLSKTRVTEMPPTATRSKLEKTKQNALFSFYPTSTTFRASQTKTLYCSLWPLIYHVKSFKYIFLMSPQYSVKKIYLSVLSPCMHQQQGIALHCYFSLLSSIYQPELILTSHL